MENSDVKDVIEWVVIENVNDALRFLFSYFRTLKCAGGIEFFESFQFLVGESFKCSCGLKRNEEVFYFGAKVEISEIEDLGVSFLKVFQKYRKRSTFSICADMDCVEKKSQIFGVAVKTPLYLILEVDFKLDYYEILKQSFDLEVKSGDFYTHKNQVSYEIYMICASNIDKTFLFLCHEENWIDIQTDLICNLDNMIFYLNSFHCKINLIIYKQKPSTTSENLKKAQTPSPQKTLCHKCYSIKLDNSPTCKACLDQKKKSAHCKICQYPLKSSSKNCENCEKTKAFKINLLQSNCPECSTPVINGQKCKTCNSKQHPELVRPITASSPVYSSQSPLVPKILCKKCSSPLESSKEECGMCKVPEETKAAIPLKGTSIHNNIQSFQSTSIQPKTLAFTSVSSSQAISRPSRNSERLPKRQGSTSKTILNCGICSSKLSNTETRNCLHCKKTHSGANDKCPYCNKVSHVCDSCLKKLKSNKINNK